MRGGNREGALRELRRIKFRIYLDLSFLYFGKFRLKCRDGTLHVLVQQKVFFS